MADARGRFYKRESITNIAYAQVPTFSWSFGANHLIIVNDSNQNITFSFNGEDDDGELFPRDKSISLDWTEGSKLWIKTSAASPTQVRVWAWV